MWSVHVLNHYVDVYTVGGWTQVQSHEEFWERLLGRMFNPRWEDFFDRAKEDTSERWHKTTIPKARHTIRIFWKNRKSRRIQDSEEQDLKRLPWTQISSVALQSHDYAIDMWTMTDIIPT